MPKTAMTEETVASALSTVESEVEALKEEMENWRDNMPENMQGGDKYDAVSEACDNLDGYDHPSVDELNEASQEANVSFHESRAKRKSRAERRDSCTARLAACNEALTDRAAEMREVAYALEKRTCECERCGTNIVLDDDGEWVSITSMRECDSAPKESIDKKHAPSKSITVDKNAKKYGDLQATFDCNDYDKLEEWANTCEEIAAACEEQQQQLESIDFPGMRG